MKENVWQLIGDSSLNNLSNPEFIPLEAKHIENRIYVLYISQQSLQEGKFKEDLILKTYEYSKKIPNTKHTLKIWSLEENETIKAVLNSFRRENPDWQIIYEIATDVNGTKTKSDIIRQFNSEVYAGNGPDIIILDGLPIQTYVEKNILHDFSSEIIDQKSELLPAIQKNYLSKSCYALPSKIIIPLLVGEPTVLIENLDNFLEQSIKMPEMSAENIFDICFRFFSEGLELNKSKLKSKDVKEFLELCKKASKKWNYIKNPKIPYDYNGSWYELLTGETDIEFSYAYGLNQISNTLDAIEQTNSSYQIVENRFIPKGILGINNSSKNKEKAFEFIKKAIGQESQKNDLDDGFPVNVAALDSWKGRENNMMIGMGDSEETMQSVGQPSQNMLERFVEDIKKVEVPIVFDEVISEMLREETMKVIQDETTIEESVKRIMNRLELYYEE